MRRDSVATHKSPTASARPSGEYSRLTPSFPTAWGGRATLDDDGNSTCLSALPHNPDPDRDSMFQHFLGCLEFHKRSWFLDYQENPFWQAQVRELVELERSKRKATKQGFDEQRVEKEAEDRVRKTIQALAISIEAQYKRTAVLRHALSKRSFTSQPEPAVQSQSGGNPPQQPQEAPRDQFQARSDPAGQPSSNTGIRLADVPELRSLVWYINKSRDEWRESTKYYKDGIEKVRDWRKSQKPPLPVDRDQKSFDGTTGPLVVEEPGRKKVREIVGELRGEESITKEKISDYSLERDVNAYLIQYTRKPKAAAIDDASATGHDSSDTKMLHLPARPHEEKLEDVRFKGKFPDQRVSVDLLLRSAHTETSEYNSDIPQKGPVSNGTHGNILSKDDCDKKDPTRMRYLHIPANNMEWVESAIAGYYGDTHNYKQPALRSGRREFPATTRTQMLLRPQYWRGQLHGARSGAVHARYMRPLCERVSSSVHVIEENPNNIVLFASDPPSPLMPYMHWETDRMRNTVAKMIDDQTQKQLQKQEDREWRAKDARQKQREGVGSAGKQLKHADPDVDGQPTVRPAKLKLERTLTLRGLVTKVATLKPGTIVVEQDGHLKVRSGHPLGQYLLDAARLYEAMSTFRDQRMIEKYLYHNPPLHPRRTLDQSHYWTLKTTKARDRDQVVYRGTNINLEVSHKLCEVLKDAEERRNWMSAIIKMWRGLPSKGPTQGEDEKKLDDGANVCYQWDKHWSKTDRHGCEHCASEIKKISKLIMVDQLWMWVLDEQTIITSFPRRYGYNKFDLHGIHKSIRNRLSNARKNQIRSIFDVALIILDECTNTFFDRTKTHDSQPQVMDIFSEAIGDVHVWHWTQKASKVYRSKPEHNETQDLHVPLLDIHPEGKLQREVKDILDELDIMINITRRQRELIKRFCRHVENILDPEGRWRHGSEDQSHGVAEDDEFKEKETANASTTTPRMGDSANQGSRAKGATQSLSGKGVANDEEKAKQEEEKRDKSRRKKHLEWFRMQSQDLLCEVGDRIEELEGLRESAKSTAQSVNDLLSLKQQQASVVQAWESVNQAEEAVRQGRAIMMFTIITIIFLPLSFMSSIFGMNNIDLEGPGNTWTLRGQLEIMFPIAIGITVASLFFAFFAYLRAFIWSGYTYLITLLVVKSGLYYLWLEYGGKNLRSATLMRSTAEKVHQLKEDVRKARRQNRSRKANEAKASGDSGGSLGGEDGVGEVQTEPSDNGLDLSFKGLKEKFRVKLRIQDVSEHLNENGKESV
ncbi:hypothetical protein B0T14DRAFT_499008 [Immersiella caudata]|uniref:Ankyrin repeat protein n=1 Tax=Immersiella caudata TaxID=314043 RepID=A0AA39WDS1_9PEZI|nr:hypothetical protein B0T14DRAFT_499008 [Immersiella caudata]